MGVRGPLHRCGWAVWVRGVLCEIVWGVGRWAWRWASTYPMAMEVVGVTLSYIHAPTFWKVVLGAKGGCWMVHSLVVFLDFFLFFSSLCVLFESLWVIVC